MINVRKNLAILLMAALLLLCAACGSGGTDKGGVTAAETPGDSAPGAAGGGGAVSGNELSPPRNTDNNGSAGGNGNSAAGSNTTAPGVSLPPSSTGAPVPSDTVSLPDTPSAPPISPAPSASPGGPATSPSAPASAPNTPGTSSAPPISPAPSASPGGPATSPSAPASASNTPGTSSAPPISPAAPAQPSSDGEPVVLTIKGDGVTSETAWTLGQLKSMPDGYREYTYSTTNNWPSFGQMAANGISLPYLLRQAGLRTGAAAFKLSATDGYYVTLTYAQIFGTRYAYKNHSRDGSGGATAVEPVVAWEWSDTGAARPENIRSFIGQSGPQDVNTASFVENLCLIEVLTVSPGEWDAPGASIADGSAVPAGTELRLTHDNMDNVRIYYTLDGSAPDYNSPVYNPSASYFQPQLTAPIILTGNVTVKAFAAGLGRDPSPIATFSYVVSGG